MAKFLPALTKTVSAFSAFVIALLPLAGLTIVAISVYEYRSDEIGIGIIAAIGLFGLFLSYKIFRLTYTKGIIGTYATVDASPDADHPEPSEGSNFQRCLPEDVDRFINMERSWTQNAMVSVYGDYYQRPFKKAHKIAFFSHEAESNILTIRFEGGQTLVVTNPQEMFEANTYLKILKADEVKYEWDHARDGKTISSGYTFTPSGRRILTETFPENMHPRFEIGLNMPAIMLLGI